MIESISEEEARGENKHATRTPQQKPDPEDIYTIPTQGRAEQVNVGKNFRNQRPRRSCARYSTRNNDEDETKTSETTSRTSKRSQSPKRSCAQLSPCDRDANEAKSNATMHATETFTTTQVTEAEAEAVIKAHEENPSLAAAIATAPLTLSQARTIIASVRCTSPSTGSSPHQK